MDQHNRPYKCKSDNCLHTKGFGSKGELKRHTESVHEKTNLFCPVAYCLYSCPRKDNLQDHMNRQHKHRILEHSATPQEDCNSPAGDQDIPSSDFNRQASLAGQVDVTVRSARKRRRAPDRTSSSENADSANEELHGLREEIKKLRRENEELYGIREENKKLKQEIESLKREHEPCKAREENLFEVIRKWTK